MTNWKYFSDIVHKNEKIREHQQFLVELLELLNVLLLNTLKGRKGSQNISDTTLRSVK